MRVRSDEDLDPLWSRPEQIISPLIGVKELSLWRVCLEIGRRIDRSLGREAFTRTRIFTKHDGLAKRRADGDDAERQDACQSPSQTNPACGVALLPRRLMTEPLPDRSAVYGEKIGGKGRPPDDHSGVSQHGDGKPKQQDDFGR